MDFLPNDNGTTSAGSSSLNIRKSGLSSAQSNKSSSSSSSSLTNFLLALFYLAIIGGICFGGWKLYQHFRSTNKDILPSSSPSPSSQQLSPSPSPPPSHPPSPPSISPSPLSTPSLKSNSASISSSTSYYIHIPQIGEQVSAWFLASELNQHEFSSLHIDCSRQGLMYTGKVCGAPQHGPNNHHNDILIPVKWYSFSNVSGGTDNQTWERRPLDTEWNQTFFGECGQSPKSGVMSLVPLSRISKTL